jgi:hypothetical protein
VFITTGVFAQTESKTFKETFNVGENTVLNINTSNTDIEFETWDKNQVEITATIELDGATSEEAERYFKNGGIEIKGNSKEIDITTGAQNRGLFTHNNTSSWINSNIDFDVEPFFEDLRFPELAELSELSELAELAVIPEMPVIPNLPPMPNIDFDYKAFEKDGEKYMKEWKKQFDKYFDEEFKKNFEAWGKEFEKLNEERSEKMVKSLEKQKLAHEKMHEKMAKKQEKMHLLRDSLHEKRHLLGLKRDSLRFFLRDSLRNSKPNIFYFSSDKKNKKYKVKKTIKIKMPKSVKLKMNVRHGEVKLAATIKNLDANLQYASLLGDTIEGIYTDIRASYTPLVISNWINGNLNTNYSNNVYIKEVKDIKLNSVSSNITIDNVLNNVSIENDFGKTSIKRTSANFKKVYVSLKSGELIMNLPVKPYNLYVISENSNVNHPSDITIEKYSKGTVSDKDFLSWGSNKKRDPSLIISAKFSDVTLKD